MGEFENSYKNMLGKHEEKGGLVTWWSRWKDNAEIGPNKWGMRVCTGFNRVRMQSICGLWGSIRARYFYNNYYPFQNDRGLT
jgi:hypothetical protein